MLLNVRILARHAQRDVNKIDSNVIQLLLLSSGDDKQIKDCIQSTPRQSSRMKQIIQDN